MTLQRFCTLFRRFVKISIIHRKWCLYHTLNERVVGQFWWKIVGSAIYRVVSMQRTVTRDIVVEVRQSTAPWLDDDAHDAVLRLKSGVARYDGSYIVFGYHWDGEQITIKGIFRRPPPVRPDDAPGA